MKTQSTSTRPDQNHSQETIKRAKQYAYGAILSPVLIVHYRRMAKSMKLRGPLQAAFRDYLNHEREFRELNKKL